MPYRKPKGIFRQKPPPGPQLDFSNPLSRGLILCTLSNEGGGLYIDDLSGCGNTGVPESVTIWGEGRFGQCCLDGSLAGNTDITFNTGRATGYGIIDICRSSAFSISFWAFPTDFIVTRVMWDKTNNLAQPIGWYVATTTTPSIQYQRGGTGANLILETNGPGFATNIWYHIVITGDGSTNAANYHIYINGLEYAYTTQQNGSSSNSDSGQHLIFGGTSSGSGGAGSFSGKMDMPMIWTRRQLKQNEAMQLYTNPLALFIPPKRRIISAQGVTTIFPDKWLPQYPSLLNRISPLYPVIPYLSLVQLVPRGPSADKMFGVVGAHFFDQIEVVGY